MTATARIETQSVFANDLDTPTTPWYFTTGTICAAQLV
jgi:hypothetical protein